MVYETNFSLENGKRFYRPKRCVVFDTEASGKVQYYNFFNKR